MAVPPERPLGLLRWILSLHVQLSMPSNCSRTRGIALQNSRPCHCSLGWCSSSGRVRVSVRHVLLVKPKSTAGAVELPRDRLYWGRRCCSSSVLCRFIHLAVVQLSVMPLLAQGWRTVVSSDRSFGAVFRIATVDVPSHPLCLFGQKGAI